MEVIWVSGYPGIRGNKKAYECGVHRSSLDEEMTYNEGLIPLVVVKHRRYLWPLRSKRTQIFLSFERVSISF